MFTKMQRFFQRWEIGYCVSTLRRKQQIDNTLWTENSKTLYMIVSLHCAIFQQNILLSNMVDLKNKRICKKQFLFNGCKISECNKTRHKFLRDFRTSLPFYKQKWKWVLVFYDMTIAVVVMKLIGVGRALVDTLYSYTFFNHIVAQTYEQLFS